MRQLLPFRRREGTINHELLLRLGRELEARCSRTEGTGHSFIHPEVVEDVLQPKHVRELLSSFSWYREDDRLSLYGSMRLIICILVLMRWEHWEQFHRYFFYPVSGFRRPRYTDEQLPISSEDFLQQAPPDFLRTFLAQQYTFKPVFIHENSHLKYSTDHRLPFLQAVRLQDAAGAQGIVERVRVERKFLYYANGASNHAPQVMACKRITARTPEGNLNFDAEQRILEQFKLCTTDNKNIMQSFASFIHGSDFIILSRWADGRDLDLFLTRPDEILDHYMMRSIRFSPDNLLTEAYNLARALKFLHQEMVTTRGKQLRCAHLDLKPANVLVFFPPEDRATEAPVGRWKISDFGLSKVEEAVSEDRVLPIRKDVQDASTAPGNIARELSFQPPTRGAGAFQPPEVQNTEAAKVSTRRDVWSFGGILAMVLAFALGGSAEVENQTRRRSVGLDDYFYRRTNRRSRPTGPSTDSMAHNVDAELKPPFKKWVEQASRLADERHGQWIQHTSNLILTLLDVNIISRPEIMLAVETLHMITDFTELVAAYRLWGFDDDSGLPEPINIQSLESQPGQLGGETPFPTRGGYSPPSSTSHRAIRRRSPRLNSQRSSATSSIFFQSDPSLSFVKLTTPDRCHGATIEPLGSAAALWGPRDVKLYALSSLYTETAIWSDRPTSTHVELEPFCSGSIILPETSVCWKVQLAGKWVALLERQTKSACCIRVHQRVALQQAKHHLRYNFNLPQKPDDFKISSRGTLAVRYRDRVDIHTSSGSTRIPFEKDFSAMAFSLNGQYFCLWERDPRGKGHTPWNYWTVYNDAGEEFTVMGNNTIKCQLPNYTPGTLGEVLLIPFSTYPRFIACDRQQYLYLVRADAQSARAHRIAQIDNIRAGFILPDNENFMLVRGSQHDSQGAEKCLMSFMESPSIQKLACGKLYENIDLEQDGAAVIPFDDLGGSPCLLTLQPSGRLARKVL